MNNICIIPARGGSKRIKDKNIKLFNNKPIIYWSIKAATQSKCFSKIIVSTDSKAITNIVKKYKVFQNSLRPEYLSGDKVPTQAVLEYEIKKIEKTEKVDNVCCLLATAPMVNFIDLRNSLKIFKNKKSAFVFSATEFEFPIQRSFFINNTGFMKKKIFTGTKLNTQDLRKAYHDAGQFYWASAKTFCCSELTMYNSRSYPYILPSYQCVDIDEINDWKKAEAMAKVFKLLKR